MIKERQLQLAGKVKQDSQRYVRLIGQRELGLARTEGGYLLLIRTGSRIVRTPLSREAMYAVKCLYRHVGDEEADGEQFARNLLLPEAARVPAHRREWPAEQSFTCRECGGRFNMVDEQARNFSDAYMIAGGGAVCEGCKERHGYTAEGDDFYRKPPAAPARPKISRPVKST